MAIPPFPTTILLCAARVLTCGLVAATLAEPIGAYTLTGRDLRVYGFSGTYRGKAFGTVGMWNGSDYDLTPVDEPARERVTVSTREIVYGPTGTNRFFLTRRSLSGNLRRVTLRCEYSGSAANDEYDEMMKGSGSKIVHIVRRGRSRPRLEMTTKDRLEEGSVFDGTLFAYWTVRGVYRR